MRQSRVGRRVSFMPRTPVICVTFQANICIAWEKQQDSTPSSGGGNVQQLATIQRVRCFKTRAFVHGAGNSEVTTHRQPPPSSSLFTAMRLLVIFFCFHLLASFSKPLVLGLAPESATHSASYLSTREHWIQNSLSYYMGITRGSEHVQSSPNFLRAAMDTYFATEKIKKGENRHAETIYRRLMETMLSSSEEEGDQECYFSSLAVPTLLLGLLLQREGRMDDARTVFEGFSHVLASATDMEKHKCSCSARVLQAHALFEMKQNNRYRAVELILQAINMDKNLRPVLRWKQFREALVETRQERGSSATSFAF